MLNFTIESKMCFTFEILRWKKFPATSTFTPCARNSQKKALKAQAALAKLIIELTFGRFVPQVILETDAHVQKKTQGNSARMRNSHLKRHELLFSNTLKLNCPFLLD